MKADSIDAFRQGIDALGFVDGYAVIGLKMILRKVWDRALLRSVRRRKMVQAAYQSRYCRENKERRREYHREYMRKWRMKRLQRVTD